MLEVVQTVGLGAAIGFTGLLGWGLRRSARQKADDNSLQAKVSVLVAARNEERDLPRCLAGLAAQDYHSELLEFIIVNDGSTDRTGEIVQEWTARDSRFRLITLDDLPVKGMGPKKRALTEGLRACRGEIVLITDADCSMKATWVRQIVGYFDEGISAVCGRVSYYPVNRFFARLTKFEGLIGTVLNAGVIGLGGALSCAGANFAYRREAFLQMGGFDLGGKSVSGDDDLLLQRFQSAGLKIRFCLEAGALVETEPPRNASAYWRRKRRHLSAGKRYALPWILIAAAIYAGCMTTTLLAILSLVGLNSNYGFLLWWGLLSASMILLFHSGLKILGEKGWLCWSFPAAILFPLYFTLIHPLTLLTSPAWKGRDNLTSPTKQTA